MGDVGTAGVSLVLRGVEGAVILGGVEGGFARENAIARGLTGDVDADAVVIGSAFLSGEDVIVVGAARAVGISSHASRSITRQVTKVGQR